MCVTLLRAYSLQSPPRQQFNNAAQHLAAVLALKGERKLSREEAVFNPDVISMALEFASQKTFASGELGKGG
jgi:hypothetical protein